jgi:hypothetical protein
MGADRYSPQKDELDDVPKSTPNPRTHDGDVIPRSCSHNGPTNPRSDPWFN